MNYYIMTLFPEMVMNGLNESIIGRAINNGLLTINPVNIRDYSNDKHGHVDDYPYGGGAGMVMKAAPVYDCYNAICEKLGGKKPRVLFMSPKGKTFNQQMAIDLSKEEELVFLCGHYEGIDQRVLDLIVTDEVSLGDFVLTGGELPAMVMIDAISRHIKGVLSNEDSAITESFTDDLLEHPQYTRPENFMDMKVPEVLLSGNHKKINEWRYEQSLKETREKRPDLYEKFINRSVE